MLQDKDNIKPPLLNNLIRSRKNTEQLHPSKNSRKQQNDFVENKQNLLHVLLDIIPDPVYAKDTECRFVAANITVANLLGAKTINEVIGKTDFDFFPEKRAQKYYAEEQEIIKTAKPIYNREESRVSSTGDVTWFLVTKVPWRDKNNKIIGIVGLAHDITIRKQIKEKQIKLMEALKVKNQELESILHIANHDLRTPLVNIAGFSGELSKSFQDLQKTLEKVDDPWELKKELTEKLKEDFSDSLDLISAGATKMKLMLDGLSHLVKAGFSAAKIERLNMNILIGTLLKTIRFQIQQAQTEIAVEELPDCLGDNSQINHVFLNLLENAIKHRDPSQTGKIRVSGRMNNGYSIYCIEDNGPGIEAGNLEDIFKVFYRLNPAKNNGEGVGLAIVRQIVNRHNGKVWAESEIGRGSNFFVKLPNHKKNLDLVGNNTY